MKRPFTTGLSSSLTLSLSVFFAICAAAAAQAAEVVVDNSAASPTFTISGTWGTLTAGDDYKDDYRRAQVAGSGGATATWKPSLSSSGNYRVSVWYPTNSSAYSAASYTVYYNGGNTACTVDQTASRGRWVPLGVFNFPSGQTNNGRVVLSNQGTSTSKYVLADAVRFCTPAYLTMAVSPPGAGTTSPAVGGPYTYDIGDPASISASANAGYVFSHWETSSCANAANGGGTSTTVLMDATKTMTAVFVTPQSVTLTMAPVVGPGTVSPAVGGPYSKTQGEVVSLTATPGPGGNLFVRWDVSAGAPVADPYLPNTTVAMDVSKTVTAEFSSPPQLRAFWADAFHDGLQNQADIDTMIAAARQGKYNAIFAEVMAYQDNVYTTDGSHGAHWHSDIVPRAACASGSFDPLAYMIEQCHDTTGGKQRLELHAWIVAFRVTTSAYSWPSGNATLSAHPEYAMVPRASIGAGPTQVSGDYVLDPGSPGAQEYLMSIVRELVSNYDIDGINWDYIRYTVTDAGYPADNNYQDSGLKRFQRIYNRTDVPLATGDAEWNEFRRRSITEVVRRVQMEIESLKPSQPLRHTCDLVTWGNAPASFSNSSAYGLFSNWEEWMRLGYIDAGCPMCYDRDHDCAQRGYYRNWVEACLDWRYQRHMFIGQANYLNFMPNSLIQLRYAFHTDEVPARSADGIVNYSYATTVYDRVWDSISDPTWYTDAANIQNLFIDTAPTPTMSWRDPSTAGEGRLWGQVTRGGLPVDDATVTVVGQSSAQTDANGIYVVTLITATGPGTQYDVTATQGSDTVLHRVVVVRGLATREDISLDPTVVSQWRSVRAHAGADQSITLEANALNLSTVECRQGGIRRIEVDFAASAELTNPNGVQVTGYTTNGGVPGGPVSYTPTSVTSVDSDTIAIDFDEGLLPDQTCYVIQLSSDLVSPPLTGDSDCTVRTLVADTTASGLVNLGDALLVRSKIGQTLDATTARFDVDLDGVIGISDVLAVKGVVTSPARQVICP